MDLLSQENRQQFEAEGYTIFREFFDSTHQEAILQAANYHFYLQVLKVFKGNSILTKGNSTNSYTTIRDLDRICVFLDENDPDLLGEVLKHLLRSTLTPVFSLSEKLIKLASEFLSCPTYAMLIESSGVSLIPSIPNNKRRLYTWHSEACWLPYRRNFINVWMPLFRSKKKGNGTMSVFPGSHKQTWHFSEYYGFNKSTEGDKTHYLQYEVPESETRAYTEIFVEADPGDIIVFDRNLLHRSEINTSSEVGYLSVCRFLNTRTDLTISSNPNIRPYTDQPTRIGRAGLSPVEIDL